MMIILTPWQFIALALLLSCVGAAAGLLFALWVESVTARQMDAMNESENIG